MAVNLTVVGRCCQFATLDFRATEKAVTPTELEAAELIFNGATAKAVAAKLGVSGRMARYVIAGEKRPNIKMLIDEFVEEYRNREKTRIVRAHSVAFESLMDAAAKATKFVRDGAGTAFHSVWLYARRNDHCVPVAWRRAHRYRAI